MWSILKLALLLAWCLTLSYLVFLSVITFIVFHVCLLILLFWLTVTFIAWAVTFIPVLTFVVIPWYQRRCRRWTVQEKQSRLSVAFFHPYGDNEDDRERVLWFAVDSLVRKHKNDLQIIIYTGETQVKPQEVLRRVNEQLDIDVERWSCTVTFVPLRSRFLLDAKYYKLGTVWGQSIGSIIVGLEALIRFVPDIYIDLTGYAFTYPCFYYLASIPIISYIHDPLVTSDSIEEANEQSPLDKSLLSQFERITRHLFIFIYRSCGRCSTRVFCSSIWTKEQIESLWKRRGLHLLHPPCRVKKSSEEPTINKDNTIVSVGHFRPNQRREFQIRAFYELLQQKPECNQQLKLVLIGRVHKNEEKKHLEQLQLLVKDLDIEDKVEFKTNISLNESENQLQQATIGLHTARNRTFDLGVADMMAAGVIVVAHQSGGVKTDLIDHGHTGFLVSDLDGYATTMQQILEMSADERSKMQKCSRQSVSRFDRSHFELSFIEPFDTFLSVK